MVAAINHANYTGSANGTLVISQPSQAITFGQRTSRPSQSRPVGLTGPACPPVVAFPRTVVASLWSVDYCTRLQTADLHINPPRMQPSVVSNGPDSVILPE